MNETLEVSELEVTVTIDVIAVMLDPDVTEGRLNASALPASESGSPGTRVAVKSV